MEMMGRLREKIGVDFLQQVSLQLLSKHANEIFQQDLKSGGANAEAK